MTLEDIPAVHAVDLLCYALVWPESSYQFDLSHNPNSRLYVAYAPAADGSERIIGVIGMWLVVDEAHIGTVAVHPDWRRKGVARKMMAHALREAAAQGMVVSHLEVRRGNIPAQGLYKSFGFEEVGERKHYYADNGEDALLLTLKDIHKTMQHIE
jgi:ribosomal-protein-alanine N-acetyltransferase